MGFFQESIAAIGRLVQGEYKDNGRNKLAEAISVHKQQGDHETLAALAQAETEAHELEGLARGGFALMSLAEMGGSAALSHRVATELTSIGVNSHAANIIAGITFTALSLSGITAINEQIRRPLMKRAYRLRNQSVENLSSNANHMPCYSEKITPPTAANFPPQSPRCHCSP